MRHVTSEDIRRTKSVLVELAKRQEYLGKALAAIPDFVDRSEWLVAHRTRDEQLAWDRRWRHLKPKAKVPRVPRQPKLTGDEVISELEWLMRNGASAWEAAEALKRQPKNLARLAYRKGRADLATFIDRTEQAA